MEHQKVDFVPDSFSPHSLNPLDLSIFLKQAAAEMKSQQTLIWKKFRQTSGFHFRQLVREMIMTIELQSNPPSYKKMVKNLVSALESIPNIDVDIIGEVLDLPIYYKSRWELLSILLPIVPHWYVKDANILEELLASAGDQDCAAHSSSLIISIINTQNPFHPNFPDVVLIMLNALLSPESATRSNALRSWFSRVIAHKSSEVYVYGLTQSLLQQTEIGREKGFDSDQINSRMIQGISCVDVLWRQTFTADSSPQSIIALNSLLRCYIAASGKGSQVKIGRDDIEISIQLGVKSYDSEIRLLAYELAHKTNCYPAEFDSAVKKDLAESAEMKDDIVKLFGSAAHNDLSKVPDFIKELVNSSKKKNLEKFYPISFTSQFSYQPKLENVETVEQSADEILEFQGSVQYPSVALVMEQLKKQNIDERAYVQRMVPILDFICSETVEKRWTAESAAPILFKLMSRCPLRALVDHAGGIVKKIAQNDANFRKEIFDRCVNLLSQKEENTRALTFELCLTPIIAQDSDKLTTVWTICKKMEKRKQQKMLEMLANVISSSSIQADFDTMKDILLCSIGLQPNIVSFSCSQLFVACLAKLLNTHHEIDRAILFVVAKKHPRIFELITEILNNPPTAFNEHSFHLVLHLFSRLSVGNIEFYDSEQVKVISKMTRFVNYLLLKYSKTDPLIVSGCVDAICAIFPWGWIKKLGKEKREYPYAETTDLSKLSEEERIRSVIGSTLEHHHYWLMYKNAVERNLLVRICDCMVLPGFNFISEVHTKNLSEESLEKLDSFLEKCQSKVLKHHEMNALAFLLCFQSSMWSGLSDKELKDRYRKALVSAFERTVGKMIKIESDDDAICSWITQGVFYLNEGIENEKIEFDFRNESVTVQSSSQ